MADDFPLNKVQLKKTNEGNAGSSRGAGQASDPWSVRE